MAWDKLFVVLAITFTMVLITEIKVVQGNFQFLEKWKRITPGDLQWKVKLDCRTNDPSARTELWHRDFSKVKETNVTGKLLRDGDIYIISNAVISDQGDYTCKAFNKDGASIEKKTLLFLNHIRKPTYSIYPIYAQDRQVGESIKFTLTAKTVIPIVTWNRHTTVNGKDVSYNITADHNITVIETRNPDLKLISTLNLYNLKLEDGGHYQATGRFKKDIHTELFTVHVFATSRPIISKKSPDFKTSESRSHVFQCVSYGYPPPDIEWYKDGEPIPQCKENCKYEQLATHKSSNKSDSSLTIKDIVYSDAGSYKCKAINNYGIAEAVSKLSVQTKPYISKSKSMSHLSYQDDKIAKVTCKLIPGRGEPLPRFSWSYQKHSGSSADGGCEKVKNWLSLPSTITYETPLNQTSASSTIVIPPNIPPLSQAACFRCLAVNQFGNDNFTTQLYRYKYTEEEFFKIRPSKPQMLNALETLKLQCFLLLDKLNPYSLVWQKDGVNVDHHSDPRITHKFDFEKNSSDIFNSKSYSEVAITISNLTINDSGLYSCSVAGDNLNRTVSVKVRAVKAPQLSWKEDGITVFEQNYTSVRLHCILEKGNPKPDFYWFRNKKPLHPVVSENPNCDTVRDGFYFARNNEQEVVICGKPLRYEDYSGIYTCKARNSEGEDEISTSLEILGPAAIIEPDKKKTSYVLNHLETLNKTCKARGNPSPEVQWWKGSDLIKSGNGADGIWIEISSSNENSFDNYSCVAKNWHTDYRFVLVKKAPKVGAVDNQLTKEHIIGLVLGCILFVLLVAIIFCFVYRRQKRKMDLYYMRAAGMNNYELDPDRSILEQVNDIPYDPDWEFREDRLILGRALGSGAFGQVVMAEAIGILAFNPRDKTSDAFKRRSKIRRSIRFSKMEQDPQHWKFSKTTVAVKMLKENAGESEYRDLASEIKIMIHIGEHQNIINILGACTQGKKLMLIMEYAMHGSLLHFLRERRSIFRASWTKTVNDPKQEYTLVDMVMAAFQISRGMEFLASRRCIHRDLAARNVLIGQDYVMKIADFGLARDIYKDDEYIKQTSGLLPVKWMALESLFDRTYTEKSDVWAFGIVLWEIFTLGGTPYPGLPTESLLDFLTEGRRMAQPEHCPLEVYAIMRDCWMQQPDSRPHFQTLAEHLGKILEKNITKDNPYIVLAVEETDAGNNYYLNPVDDPRLAASKPSSSNYYESPSPLNFEPILSPSAGATGDALPGYNSPLPSVPPALPDQGENIEMTDYPLPLPPVPPSYDEALASEGDSAIREKAQLAEEEKKRMAEVAVREGSKSSADEGIGLDENGQNDEEELEEASERSQLLGGSQPITDNGSTRFSPNRHGNKRVAMESTV